MPCTYTGSLEGDRALLAEESSKTAKSELDRITSYLCAVCNYLEFTGSSSEAEEFLAEAAANKHLPKHSITDWWQDHKLSDLRKNT